MTVLRSGNMSQHVGRTTPALGIHAIISVFTSVSPCLRGIFYFCGFFAVVAVLLALSAINHPTLAAGPLRVGESPPRVRAVDMNGISTRIPDDLRGRVVVLHFWAIGCSSCREEMPALDSIYAKYRKKGLVVLAVNVGQRRDEVKKFLSGLRVGYPVLLDPGRSIAREYEVVGLPRTLILDRSGIIRFKIVGSANGEILQKYITSLL